MSIRIGARQAAGNFRAIDRRGKRTESVVHDGYVEPSEMEEFEHRWIAQQARQVRCLRLSFRDLNQMRIAVSGRHLHDAEPIAVRVEAHRFAITGHRQRRSKARKESSLEQIPGLGPKRRRELLKHFGGQQGIRKATEEEIGRVTGISKKLAENIYAHLHNIE